MRDFVIVGLFFIVGLERCQEASARAVSAKYDLCARLPHSRMCQGQQTVHLDSPVPNHNQVPYPRIGGDDPPPTTLAPPGTIPPRVYDHTPKGTYCDAQQKHYYDYCKDSNHPKKRDKSLIFCQEYESTCFVSTVFPSAAEVLMGSTLSPINQRPIRKDGKESSKFGYHPLLSGGGLTGANPAGDPVAATGAAAGNPPSGLSPTNPAMGTAASDQHISAVNPTMADPAVASQQQQVQAVNPAMTGATGQQQFNWQQPLGFLSGTNPTQQNVGYASVPGAPAVGGQAPLGIGRSVNAPFFGGTRGTAVNPLQGVSTGWGVNAAGLPISATRGVSFGGLIPGGLSNLYPGRRRR